MLFRSYVRYVDLPQNFDAGVGGEFWRREIEALRDDLAGLSGNDPSDQRLRQSIAVYNRNRAAAEIRLAFSKNGGNLGETGCVGYLFEHRSVVRLEQANLQEEQLLEQLLELEEQGGPAVLSYEIDADGAEIIGAFEQLEALQDGLRRIGLAVSSWEHRWIAATTCPLEDPGAVASCLKLLDTLEELDDVRSVTSNLEADDALLEAALS